MASDDVQTNLRLPADLKDRLMASAAKNNRSLSAEVASRLEGSYSLPSEPYATKSQLERVFKRITQEQSEAMMAVSLVRDMLGTYVTILYRRLSKADQQKDEYRVMHDLARAAIDADGAKIREAAERKMTGTPGFDELGNPNAFFEFLGLANQRASEQRRKAIDGPGQATEDGEVARPQD